MIKILSIILSFLNTTFMPNVSSFKMSDFINIRGRNVSYSTYKSIPVTACECILYFTNTLPNNKRNSRTRSLRNITKRRKGKNSTKEIQDQHADVYDIIPYIEIIPYNPYTTSDH